MGILEIKVKDEVDVGLVPSDFFAEQFGSAWTDLVSKLGRVEIRRSFSSGSLATLAGWISEKSVGVDGHRSWPNFSNFMLIEGGQGISLLEEFFEKHGAVVLDSVQVFPFSRRHASGKLLPCSGADQLYLGAAPIGVDAVFAWNSGATGQGVRLVDVEQGWVFVGIPDFKGVNIVEIPGGMNVLDGHGTKVLGVIGANNDGQGVTGIAYGLDFIGLSSIVFGSILSPQDAIVNGAKQLNSGDIMLIEESLQAGPVESMVCLFNLIKCLVDVRQICVIEPVGDGGGEWKASGDSGAVVVGAVNSISTPQQSYQVAHISNYGDRVDCYAWGDGICTAGRAGLSLFDSTSGAAAIIAGVASCIQSFARKGGKPGITPPKMRTLLNSLGSEVSNQRTGTKEKGRVPDLKAILGSL